MSVPYRSPIDPLLLDALTGLSNRNAFFLALDRYFQRLNCPSNPPPNGHTTAATLITIEIDSFREINNAIGHHIGDQLLIEIGKRISAYFPNDTLIARVDSNTFTVLTPGTTNTAPPLDITTHHLNGLQKLLQKPVHYADHTLNISVSIGLCHAPDPAKDTDQLIRGANIALTQAKKAGGNRLLIFKPDMQQQLEKKMQRLGEIRRGMERKEFLLYYQPIYDMQTQTLAGFEALMRWSPPQQEVQAPTHFEMAFKDRLLAPQLGETALRSALRQMHHWVQQGFDFKCVSVNVATTQFYPENLAAHILDLLQEYKLRPDQLTLEITENSYLGPGADTVEHALRALHEAGVKIALDDFGTGYASLVQLQRFPIDTLKIDKSFVQNPHAHVIVNTIIMLGQELDIQVVAEGIETGAHKDALLQSGCRYGQGYYLGKPMPAAFYA